MGVPVFGAGWLLLVWAVFSLGLLLWLLRRQGWNAETRSYLPLLVIVGALIWFVLPRLEEQPAVGPPKGLPIRGYGVMLLVAVVAGVGLAIREARRVGLDSETILSLAFYAFLGGILGARLFYIIEYWPQFRRESIAATLAAAINVTEGGLVVYGSLLGGLATGLWFVRRRRLPPLAMADLIAPSLLLGLALGRIGCLLNGCCHGGVCHQEPWGITFPAGSPPYVHQRSLGQLHGFRIAKDRATGRAMVDEVEPQSPAALAGLSRGTVLRSVQGKPADSFEAARKLLSAAPPELTLETERGRAVITLPGLPERSRPVQPTQIYSAINAALICLLLWSYYPFRRRDGEVFALLLTVYPITRFLLEIIRRDEPGQFGTSLTISQWMSLLLVIAGVVLWVHLLRQPRGTAFPRHPGGAAAATG
jgi:phosphatidylglycerol:prolipoprotein diacylglycerol transferase